MVLTVHVQGLFVAPDIHKDCNTIYTMYHNTQYCNTPQDCNITGCRIKLIKLWFCIIVIIIVNVWNV